MKKQKMTELKELEKIATRIAKKRERLESQLQAETEMAKWYDDVLKESDFKRPRDLIKAMMEHFGFRTISLAKGKRGPGRPAKGAPKANGAGPRRKRTKVTAAVRDNVKEALGKGVSKNAAAKKFGVSYPLIKKIQDGAYDSI